MKSNWELVPEQVTQAIHERYLPTSKSVALSALRIFPVLSSYALISSELMITESSKALVLTSVMKAKLK